MDAKKQFEFGNSIELKILHCALTRRRFLTTIIDYVNKEYFQAYASQVIYDVTIQFFKKYKTIPSNDVFLNLLKARFETESKEVVKEIVQHIIDVKKCIVSPEEEVYLKDECLLFCKRQAFTNCILNAPALLKDNQFDHIERQVSIANMIGDIGEDEIEYFKDPIARLSSEIDAGICIPTGLETLDRYLDGKGYNTIKHPLVLFMAPSGVGKSILLVHTGATGVKHGKTVFHYTFELSSLMTAARYDVCLTSGVRINERVQKKDTIAHQLKAYVDTDEKNLLFIKEYSTGTCTANMIRADIEKKITQGYTPDMIIIDYMDIMRASEHNFGDNAYAEQQRISEELRAIAQDYNVCVFSATQTNRSGMKEMDKSGQIETDAIADSWGKVKTADLIISISRDGKNISQEVADMIEQKMTLYIAKNRSGVSFKSVKAKVDYNTMTLTDISATLGQNTFTESSSQPIDNQDVTPPNKDNSKNIDIFR